MVILLLLTTVVKLAVAKLKAAQKLSKIPDIIISTNIANTTTQINNNVETESGPKIIKNTRYYYIN